MNGKLRAAAVACVVAMGLGGATASADTGGGNSGSAPDNGNCFGNFVNEGDMGYNASNYGPPGRPDGLGQTIGKEEHGCR